MTKNLNISDFIHQYYFTSVCFEVGEEQPAGGGVPRALGGAHRHIQQGKYQRLLRERKRSSYTTW